MFFTTKRLPLLPVFKIISDISLHLRFHVTEILLWISFNRLSMGCALFNDLSLENGRKNAHPFGAIVKKCGPETAKQAPEAEIAQLPEPVIVRKCLKSPIFRLFAKENCTAARIHMVSKLLCSCGAEGGIRTLETLLTFTRFPIVRARPTTRLLHIRSRNTNIHFLA